MDGNLDRLGAAYQAAAMELPRNDRAELAEFLIGTLDRDDEDAVKAEWLALASRRMADVRAGKVVGIPAETVVAELLRGKRRE